MTKILPTGKSWYLWKVRDLLNGDIDAIAERAVSTGVSSIWVKASNGVNAYNLTPWPMNQDTIMPRFMDVMHNAGLKVLGWHYIFGQNPQAEAEQAIRRQNYLHFDGWIVDAEAEFEVPGMAPAARTYMHTFRNANPDLPIGLSSYRYPSLHKTVPWAEFLDHCDFNAPQMYWMGAHNPGFQLDRTLAEYRALYASLGMGGLPTIPVGAAFHENGWQSTPAEIVEFFARVQAIGLLGCSFWEWANAYRYDLESAVAGLHWGEQPPPVLTWQQEIDAWARGLPDGLSYTGVAPE